MNRVHQLYCRSGRWRTQLSGLLPWATEGVRLDGATVLELGPGPGLTTDWLEPRTAHLTVIEYDAVDTAALAARLPSVDVLRGDATALPFAAERFDVVVCFTMLHHVPTVQLQDRLLAEARRVLRPGGVLAGSDSRWGPLFALAHLGDTLRLVDPGGMAARLGEAGFTTVTVDRRRSAFRFRATTAPDHSPRHQRSRADSAKPAGTLEPTSPAVSTPGGLMTLSLTCHRCDQVLQAETEDELVALGQAHAVEHGHNPPPARDHVLARVRRHNPRER